MIFTNRYFSAAKDDFSSDDFYEKVPHAIAYCEHCGFAIYSPNDALIVDGSEDIIHSACWGEHSNEHMFDFARKVSEDDR